MLLLIFPGYSQENPRTPPKLVVGVIVDQMRFDYLEKYKAHFGEGGFKRLLREGYSFENTHYNYVPTVTAAGHASVYSGTTPSVHGIVDNSWFDRGSGRLVSNVGDTSVRIMGAVVERSYGYSPSRLVAATISDHLRKETNSKARVISVSLKDRGAILPGGHSANAAYWHDWEGSPGYFVSSSYYMEELPSWVVNFNNKGWTQKYLTRTWEPMLPLAEYTASAPDDNPYEGILRGKETPTFPYDLKAMGELYGDDPSYYQVLWVTPFGNTLTKDFALEALRAEDLGKDDVPDMLCVSFSTPDVAGHTFGPQAVEVEDIYLRLDRDLEDLLKVLDKKVGEGNYVLFLTSDHGAQPVVSFSKANNEPAGLAVIPKFNQDLTFHLSQKYGAFEWISYFGDHEIYLDRNLIREKKIPLEEMQREVADFMKGQPGVRFSLTPDDLSDTNDATGLVEMVRNGYFPERSGDVFLVYEYGYRPTSDYRTPIEKVRGAGHGSGYDYDTHVPLLWFGKGIPQGRSSRKVHPVDIAPTLARLLNLKVPGEMTGTSLPEVLE